MTDKEYLDQTLTGLVEVADWLTAVQARLNAMSARMDAVAAQPAREALKAKPEVPTGDEYVAQATSVTAVWKAREAETGTDRRTYLSRVQRVVLANGLHHKVPGWSTDVVLNRKLATRLPDGRLVVDVAIAELDAA